MPKNTKKAKNSKNKTVTRARELVLKTPGQEYARATKMLGNSRIECDCYDNKTRLGVIRNKMRRGRRNRININDIILVTLRDFQDDKVDIIHVYTPDEVKKLRKMFEIPEENKEEDMFDIEFEEEENKDEKIVFDDI
jgi:translation initiation factor 1A